MKIPVLLRPVALGAHLAGIVCVGLAVVLGVWQLGSWQAHRDAAAAEHVERPPVPLDEVMGADDPFMSDDVGRSVTVAGTWLPDSTVYVSERERHGDEGWWVITPLAVTGGDAGVDPTTAPALLVVRGWTASIEPRPETPSGTAEVTAWLQPPEGAAGLVDDDRSDDVIPQVRMADAVQHVDQDLYGAYAVVQHDLVGNAAAAAADVLEPVDLDQVPEVSATTGWRNLLYGVEWWIFAGFAAFIWLRWCRDQLHPEELDGAADEAAPSDPADIPGEPAPTTAGDVGTAR